MAYWNACWKMKCYILHWTWWELKSSCVWNIWLLRTMDLDGISEAKVVVTLVLGPWWFHERPNWLDLGSRFIAALVFSPHKFTGTYYYAAHQSKAGTQLLNECPVMACVDVRRLENFLCCKFNQWTVTDHPFVSYLLVSTSKYLQSLIGHFVLPSTSSWFYRLHPQLYLPFVFIIHWFLFEFVTVARQAARYHCMNGI